MLLWRRGRRRGPGLWLAVLLTLVVACGAPVEATTPCSEFRSLAGAWVDGSLSVADLRQGLDQLQQIAADEPEAAALAGDMIAAYEDGFNDRALGEAIGKFDRYCSSRGS